MAGVITGALAESLQANRSRYNALFAQTRQTYPNLDAEAFTRFLKAVGQPTADAVARAHPERVNTVVEAVYDITLDLTARALPSRYPILSEGLPLIGYLLAEKVSESPRVVLGAVVNALYAMARTPGAKPVDWIRFLTQLSPLCPDAETLLDAGKVAAWRVGMAQYRTSALAVAEGLPENVLRVVLGLPAGISPAEALAILRQDAWQNPATIGQAASRELRIVARAGAFRGFGGPFLRPPLVASPDGSALIVTDGELVWTLHADHFGVFFAREPCFTPADLTPKRESNDMVLSVDGRLSYNHRLYNLPELAGYSSCIRVGNTLAVTIGHSHLVYLLAETTG